PGANEVLQPAAVRTAGGRIGRRTPARHDRQRRCTRNTAGGGTDQLLDLRPAALRADGTFAVADQGFELVLTRTAAVLEQRHRGRLLKTFDVSIVVQFPHEFQPSTLMSRSDKVLNQL